MVLDEKDILEILEAESFDGGHNRDDDLKRRCKKHHFRDFDECLEYINGHDHYDDDDDDDDDDDELDDEEKALIIGLVVAGVIILGLIIFLIVAKVKKCCCFKPKNKNGTTKEELVKGKSSPIGSDCESGNNPARMNEKEGGILNSNNNNINNNNDEIVYPTFGFGNNQMQGVPNQMTLVDFTNPTLYNNMNIANNGMVQNPDVYPNIIYPQSPNYQVNSPGIYTQPQMGNMMQQGQL